jgi:RNA polymerase sigma-70 factor, ECF subfamily
MTTNITGLSYTSSPGIVPGHVRPASDIDLINRVVAGNRLALQVLYARHQLAVFRFALRIVRDEAIAEDVVNEVFFEAWKKACTFQGHSQVSTWLLAITRHKAIEMLRRRRAPTEALDGDACQSVEDGADDPEVAVQKKQKGSILFECLSNLSPVHREVIDLVYYHEKSIDEVAAIIGVPRNTVKTRMFYARRQLASLLAAKGVVRAA